MAPPLKLWSLQDSRRGSVDVLRMALGKLRCRATSDGMVELTGTLERELGNPLWRAVLRIEKELVDQEVAEGDSGVRTAEQQRADAFVLLTQRLTSALDGG